MRLTNELCVQSKKKMVCDQRKRVCIEINLIKLTVIDDFGFFQFFALYVKIKKKSVRSFINFVWI